MIDRKKIERIVFFLLVALLLPLNTGYCDLGADIYEALDIEKPSKIVPAPDFSLNDLDGETFTLKQYKGRIVLLNFWATWCRPCIKEMPSLNRVYEKFQENGLVVLGVSLDNGMERPIRSFVKTQKLLFPVLWDKEGDVRDMYEVYALPLTYLIDKEGRFIGRIAGEKEWDSPDIFKAFEQLLQ